MGDDLGVIWLVARRLRSVGSEYGDEFGLDVMVVVVMVMGRFCLISLGCEYSDWVVR